MQYKISLNANISSKLSPEDLNKKLVLALYDVETGYSKLDGVDEELEVLDYVEIHIEELFE